MTDKPVEPLSAEMATELCVDSRVIYDALYQRTLCCIANGQHTVIAMTPDEFAALKRDAEAYRADQVLRKQRRINRSVTTRPAIAKEQGK